MAPLKSSTSSLYLTSHAFACRVDDKMVFLDIKKDRYLQLDSDAANAAAAMLGLVDSAPVSHNDALGKTDKTPAKQDVDQREAIIDQLIELGLASRTPSGAPRRPFAESEHLYEAPGFVPGDGPHLRAGDIINLIRAYVATLVRLRLFGLERAIARIQQRNRDRLGGVAGDGPASPTLDLIERYKMMKPIVVKTKDNCLFNALLLIEFLALHGEAAELWIGVRADDFAAHAWVRQGDMLIDDFLHTIAQYRPVLAV